MKGLIVSFTISMEPYLCYNVTKNFHAYVDERFLIKIFHGILFLKWDNQKRGTLTRKVSLKWYRKFMTIKNFGTK